MQTIENKIVSRIYGNGRGWTFSQKDFADLAARSTTDWALHRLQGSGTIRRVLRGLYDYPRFSEFLQVELSPSLDSVAQALARKFGWQIQPSGATALNLIGLSTQVPGRVVYLSDGPDRTYRIGKTSLLFEHATLKEAKFKHQESGLIVQALKSLGQERVDDAVIEKIRRWLPARMRAKVRAETKRATGWVYEAIAKITAGASDE
jgi:Family of unknown function (DUF6088)